MVGGKNPDLKSWIITMYFCVIYLIVFSISDRTQDLAHSRCQARFPPLSPYFFIFKLVTDENQNPWFGCLLPSLPVLVLRQGHQEAYPRIQLWLQQSSAMVLCKSYWLGIHSPARTSPGLHSFLTPSNLRPRPETRNTRCKLVTQAGDHRGPD